MEFPSTHLESLLAATLNGDTRARHALENFYTRYRTAVMACIRARGVLPDEVEDVFQSFMVHVMDSSVLRKMDPQRGRFRNYLRVVVRDFVFNYEQKKRAAKRGGKNVIVSMETAEDIASPAGGDEFDREWALSIFRRALEETEAKWNKKKKKERFEVLKGFLPGASEALPAAETANRLGISYTALRTEVSRLRVDYRRALREAVAETVGRPDEVGDELRYLRKILTQTSHDGIA
jgi:RNA polymerase sigma factor (sigma-70 family)